MNFGNKKIIYVDIDETICEHPFSDGARDYSLAIPIKNNIAKINDLYDEGNKIIYWTARGATTGIDWLPLTLSQLSEWGAKHTQLKMGKPSYDVFICDKAFNSYDFFKKNKMETSLPMKYVEKGWGWERWVVNCEEYCGKLLFFKKGKRCSWHYHKIKDEVFYLQSGKLMVYYSDKDDIEECNQLVLNPGDNFHVYRGLRHQMIALEDSELFEFSTQHFDEDSHRILKGD